MGTFYGAAMVSRPPEQLGVFRRVALILPALWRSIFVLPGNMMRNIIAIASRLSDSALGRRLRELASNERGATVELIAHLADR